jgi:hypothetical protein
VSSVGGATATWVSAAAAASALADTLKDVLATCGVAYALACRCCGHLHNIEPVGPLSYT